VLRLVASGGARTRRDIALATGLAPSTVSQRVDALRAVDLLIDGPPGDSTGGRPPVGLALNPRSGVVLAADLGATHSRLAVADLSTTVLAEQAHDLNIAEGPDTVLRWVQARFRQMLQETGFSPADVRAVGVGVPGPVEFSSGTVVRPPIMPGWDGVRIPSYFTGAFDAAVLVDNDVNVMALGEDSVRAPSDSLLLYIKVGTGIGCGIVTRGVVHRGIDGAAGDIGHIQVAGHDGQMCRCGNIGCVEAIASGSALARDLARAGLATETPRDVVRLALEGNPTAVRSVRVAAGHIGEVVAALVNFYNPATITVGGALAAVRDDLLAGIRAVVYRRATPLATRALTIEASRLGERSGVVGAMVLAREHILSPQGLHHLLEPVSARGASAPGSEPLSP